MPDEIAAALQEIAGLLRERVEMAKEAREESRGRLSALDQHKETQAKLQEIREESETRMSGWRVKLEAEEQHKREKTERLEAEQREFREQLLAELRRHNALLEQLMNRGTGEQN